MWELAYDQDNDSVVKYLLNQYSNPGLRPALDGAWPTDATAQMLSGTPAIRLSALAGVAATDGPHQKAAVIVSHLDRLSVGYAKPKGGDIKTITAPFDDKNLLHDLCMPEMGSTTVTLLLKMVLDRKALLTTGSTVASLETLLAKGDYSAVLLISCMSMLSVHLYQLERKKVAHDLSKDKLEELRNVLTAFIDKPPMDCLANPVAGM